ncbi:hypothetical protein CLV98_1236 [Dyadobacter jejuensis]|uniref:Uncharacterized protein n=1 Tax=Dyadobacter jejuensis TaxID=1082580 RepID=A0A316A724_9BACT|nr:hypothetical protein [Dyadobacter jejuensis]PWJ53393.1 hypothetical protein CLV98_1236 [Dyadobacter jejuensis]
MKTFNFIETKRKYVVEVDGSFFYKNKRTLTMDFTKIEKNPSPNVFYDFTVISDSLEAAFIEFLGFRKKTQIEKNAQELYNYKELTAFFSSDAEIPTTEENIRKLLYYLNSQNWGGWRMPQMDIPYSANQYLINGTLITTIRFEQPILVGGELISKFKLGYKGALYSYYNL